MIRQWVSRFMLGRYGMDQLNRTMIILYLVLYLLSLFTGWVALDFIAVVVLLVTLFRACSRDLERRRGENLRYLQLVRPIQRRFKSCRTRMQDKEHRYFKCPNCGQEMRVPRGKGRITVHCRACGATFDEKS
jgi:predicted RNA-binding Zn-ribbon protein involved in translation (DUF1610 family)